MVGGVVDGGARREPVLTPRRTHGEMRDTMRASAAREGARRAKELVRMRNNLP